MRIIRIIVDIFIVASVFVSEYFYHSDKVSAIIILSILSVLLLRNLLNRTEKIEGKEIIFLTICFSSLLLLKWHFLSPFVVFISGVPLILFILFFGKKLYRGIFRKRGFSLWGFMGVC